MITRRVRDIIFEVKCLLGRESDPEIKGVWSFFLILFVGCDGLGWKATLYAKAY